MYELQRKKEHCSKPTDYEIKSRKPFKASLYRPPLMKNSEADMALMAGLELPFPR